MHLSVHLSVSLSVHGLDRLSIRLFKNLYRLVRLFVHPFFVRSPVYPLFSGTSDVTTSSSLISSLIKISYEYDVDDDNDDYNDDDDDDDDE